MANPAKGTAARPSIFLRYARGKALASLLISLPMTLYGISQGLQASLLVPASVLAGTLLVSLALALLVSDGSTEGADRWIAVDATFSAGVVAVAVPLRQDFELMLTAFYFAPLLAAGLQASRKGLVAWAAGAASAAYGAALLAKLASGGDLSSAADALTHWLAVSLGLAVSAWIALRLARTGWGDADPNRLADASNWHLADLKAVHEMALGAVEAGADVRVLLRRTVSAFARQFPGCEVVVILTEWGRERIVLEANYPLTESGDAIAERLANGQGILGWVVQHREPALVRDARRDERCYDARNGTLSELCVPLLIGDHVIGLINLESRRAHAFDEGRLPVVATLASQVASSVENIRNTRELLALSEVTRDLTTRHDLPTLLSLIAERAASLLSAVGGGVYLTEEGHSDLRLRACAGPDETLPQRLAAPHASPQELIGTRTQAPMARLPGMMQAPMVFGDDLVGAIVVHAADQPWRTFSEGERRQLSLFAGQAAMAVHDAHLYETAVRQLNELSLLYDAAIVSIQASQNNLQGALTPTLEAIRKLMKADHVGVIFVDGESGYVHVGVPSSPDADWALLLDEGMGIPGWVLRQRAPLNVPDVTRDQRYLALLPETRSQLCVPISVGDHISGVVNVESAQTSAFGIDDIRILSTVAAQLAILGENARLYQALETRVEELRRAQVQLERSARLAGVGQLAASLAHEINNPMASILGFSELAYQQAEGDMRSDLDVVIREAKRVRDIVRSLLDFSRKRELRKELADVNEVVVDALRLVRFQAERKRVRINEVYSTDLPFIELDVNQIKQVLLNLTTNAIQAMPEGGNLTVSTALTTTQKAELVVSVRDTGVGIPPENLPHLFEPFFTTKEGGEGTGLGLAVCYGIVQGHGGRLDVDSEVGHGTTFSICLPLVGGIS